ncbi:hypothetical protein ANRL1_04567 [Anaerolineae bacterium]|nr:hypothetical protein ANRL1_04567 [Anaerolineae bacterium]
MPEKFIGYYEYRIMLEVPGLGVYDDENWTLMEGVIAAATRSMANELVRLLIPLALDDNRNRINDELNWFPKPDDDHIWFTVETFERPTLDELAQETLDNLERAKQLAEEE